VERRWPGAEAEDMRKSKEAANLYVRKWRKANKAKGMCIHCGTSKATRGICCEKCYKMTRTAYDNYRWRKRSKGICYDCGKPSGTLSRCPDCRVSNLIACQRKRVTYLAAGRCGTCGQPLSTWELNQGRHNCSYCKLKAAHIAGRT
jgi:hypothetical protein